MFFIVDLNVSIGVVGYLLANYLKHVIYIDRSTFVGGIFPPKKPCVTSGGLQCRTVLWAAGWFRGGESESVWCDGFGMCFGGYGEGEWNVLHPRKLTWNLKMMVFNRNLLFQGLIFRFHVSFRGCTPPQNERIFPTFYFSTFWWSWCFFEAAGGTPAKRWWDMDSWTRSPEGKR